MKILKKYQMEENLLNVFKMGENIVVLSKYLLNIQNIFPEFTLKVPFKEKKYFPFNFLYNIAFDTSANI